MRAHSPTRVAAAIAVEALRAATAQRVASGLVVLLCAAICASTLLTVGRTASTEEQVLAHIDAAGSRLLVVTDTRDAGLITSLTIEVIGGFDTVEAAVGVQPPVDVTNAVVSGASTPAWRLVGSPDQAVRLTWGRWARAGEAMVSATAQATLGLVEPVGAVVDRDGNEFPVVGQFIPAPGFDFLQRGVIVSAPSGHDVAHALHVVVQSVASAELTERAVITTIGHRDLTGLRVESPAAIASLQRVVGGELGSYGRGLLALTLGLGGVLVSLVILAEVLLRRRDMGRRRALGAARWALVTFVVLRAVGCAAIGVVIGLAVGVTAAVGWAQAPPWDFAVGTGVLTVLTAGLAAGLPAVFAASRDPVAVLRTP